MFYLQDLPFRRVAISFYSGGMEPIGLGPERSKNPKNLSGNPGTKKRASTPAAKSASKARRTKTEKITANCVGQAAVT